MDSKVVSLVEAKARLSELTELVATGETVVTTKHGKPVARVSGPEMPRKPVDLADLRRLTATIAPQGEDAESFMRSLRDESRY